MMGLPEAWAECRISDIAEVNPTLDRCPYPADGMVHFVPMPAVGAETGSISVDQLRPYGEVRKGYTAFVGRDVLFAKITPCMENGKMAVVPELPLSVGFGSTEFHVLRCRTGTVPEFLYHFVSGRAFRYEAEHKMTGAVGQKRVPTSFVAEHVFPLPPLPEQHRIVAKVEELFSELDAGTASLTRARAQLKTYRQALLKAALEGKLTAPWRAANPDKLESPETLMSRIRKGRDARYAAALDEWQSALSEWRAGGEGGRKPGKPDRQAEIESPSYLKTRSDLPEGWLWCTVEGLLAKPLTNGRSVKDKAGGFPVLRLTAFQGGRLNLTEFKEGDWTEAEAASWLVEDGDFFAARGNGSKHLVGIGALASLVTQPVAYPDTMIRIAIDDALVNRNYFALVWNSRVMRNQIEAAARTTAGIYKINQPHICGFAFPLPPREEQDEILLRIVPILSNVDHQESEIIIALAKITALRQSILKRAFSGQLVAQDPADEPASALLARLAQTALHPRRKTKP